MYILLKDNWFDCRGQQKITKRNPLYKELTSLYNSVKPQDEKYELISFSTDLTHWILNYYSNNQYKQIRYGL